MKNVKKSGAVPAQLAAHKAQNPLDTWRSFTETNQAGKLETQSMLRQDQRHLCAYCEIDLLRGGGKGNDDFRVEHFHPKKRPPQPPPNWDLKWNNLLAVCHGGSVATVSETSRGTNPDYSCDVPKEDKTLDGVILNPLTDIPAFPPLFDFNEDGQMLVSSGCPPHLKAQAEKTIFELRLSGNPSYGVPATRLSKLRKAVIDTLNSKLLERVEQNIAIEDAMIEIAEMMFPDDALKPWPAFFSTIRWYLGSAAESRLKAIGYSG